MSWKNLTLKQAQENLKLKRSWEGGVILETNRAKEKIQCIILKKQQNGPMV